jgi:peptidoglycan hydrolase-like protein with peptidoglycan-binding domain
MVDMDCNVKLSSGSTGKNVGNLQTALRALGFYGTQYKIDGSFGPATKQAVIDFQSRNGCAVDGVVGSETCPRIKQQYTAKTSDTTGGSLFDCPNISLSTTKGSSEDIKKLQQALKTLGYYTSVNGKELKIDGSFGQYTRQAVIAFQKATGNKEDGVFGPQTCASLNPLIKTENSNATKAPYTIQASNVPLFARYLSGKLVVKPKVIIEETEEVEVQAETTTDTSTDTSSEDGSTDTTTTEPTTTTTTITKLRIASLGETGDGFDCPNVWLEQGSSKTEQVKKLQTGLKKLGYYTSAKGSELKIDGDFGPYTAEAVRAFQRATGHDADGVFGPKTCPDFNKKLGISEDETKLKEYTITDLMMPNPNDDCEGLTHETTLRIVYDSEHLMHIRKMQVCVLTLMMDNETVYTLDGYINDLKVVQESSLFMIELSICGYTAFLEQQLADYSGTKKRSEHLKDICKELGLKLELSLDGMPDDEFEVNPVKVEASSGGGSGKLVSMSNQDCNPEDQTESDTWADHRCNPPRCTAKSKIAHGNSSAQYARDTASHNSSARELVEFVKSKVHYEYINGNLYGDNPKSKYGRELGAKRCPDAIWTTAHMGNCANLARLLKVVCDVNNYKCIICHIPGHFYNAIWENGGWTVCDLCNSNAYGHSNHGSVKPTGTWDNPQPRLWY